MCYRNSPFCFKQHSYTVFFPDTQKKQMKVSRPLSNNGSRGMQMRKWGMISIKPLEIFTGKCPSLNLSQKIIASGLIDASPHPHLPITQWGKLVLKIWVCTRSRGEGKAFCKMHVDFFVRIEWLLGSISYNLRVPDETTKEICWFKFISLDQQQSE